MYSKEEIIKRIDESKWEDFELFIIGKPFLYDENEFETYYPKDVSEFCKMNNIE